MTAANFNSLGFSLAEIPILVVDDSRFIRLTIIQSLNEIGFKNISEAKDGHEALELIKTIEFAVILLDIEMPEMSGIEVLTQVKNNPDTASLPVIVISGSDEVANAIHCISLGAEDYLSKPFDVLLLRVRVLSAIEKKRLRDFEKMRLEELEAEKQLLEREQEKSERLLLNILPRLIAARLMQGESLIADKHESVTVAFADLVGFTELSRSSTPSAIVNLLNRIFTAFDIIVERRGAEKIKTIGDSYMFVSGIPAERLDHAEVVADCALEMLEAFKKINAALGANLGIRFGINTGSVVAGIIGKRKFAYDLWGDAVNVASRMESSGTPGMIHISQSTYDAISGKFLCESRGSVNCKGIGEVPGYYLQKRTAGSVG